PSSAVRFTPEACSRAWPTATKDTEAASSEMGRRRDIGGKLHKWTVENGQGSGGKGARGVYFPFSTPHTCFAGHYLSFMTRPFPLVTVGGLLRDEAGNALLVRTAKWSDKWGIPG